MNLTGKYLESKDQERLEHKYTLMFKTSLRSYLNQVSGHPWIPSDSILPLFDPLFMINLRIPDYLTTLQFQKPKKKRGRPKKNTSAQDTSLTEDTSRLEASTSFLLGTASYTDTIQALVATPDVNHDVPTPDEVTIGSLVPPSGILLVSFAFILTTFAIQRSYLKGDDFKFKLSVPVIQGCHDNAYIMSFKMNLILLSLWLQGKPLKPLYGRYSLIWFHGSQNGILKLSLQTFQEGADFRAFHYVFYLCIWIPGTLKLGLVSLLFSCVRKTDIWSIF